MRVSTATLALAGNATAQTLQEVAGQSAQYLGTNPGGIVPTGVQAPSISGFNEPITHPARGGLAVCVSGYVPVQASTQKNMAFNFEVPKNQSGVTQTFVSMVTSGSLFMEQIKGGIQAVNGTYDIWATYCTPANNTKPDTVEILTHGVGFDGSYWDFAPGYSYVDVATQYNRATFFYDRLGVGKSTHPTDALTVQTPLEVEILQALITKVKSGSIANGSFTNIIGTGHSFGSILTQAITSQYPSSLDTAILTGFSTNSTGMAIFSQGLNLAIAAQNAPYRFSGLSNGYLVSSSAISNQIAFLHAQDFDPAILNLAEATKGTVTFGELFTTNAVVATASNYTGNIAVVNGDNDLPFCTGNCSYPVNLAEEALKLYPQAKNKGTYLAPLTGHGVNLHYSAVAAYHYIQDFITNGTKSS